MSDLTRTVDLADGTELEVVDDPADAGLIVTGLTVSGSRTENLGNYENVEPHASVRVELSPALAIDHPDAEDALQAKLRVVRRNVRAHIEESIQQAIDRGEYE
jgi:hypothetical protein